MHSTLLCIPVYVTCMEHSQRPLEGIGSSRAGHTGHSESFCMGAGNELESSVRAARAPNLRVFPPAPATQYVISQGSQPSTSFGRYTVTSQIIGLLWLWVNLKNSGLTLNFSLKKSGFNSQVKFICFAFISSSL